MNVPVIRKYVPYRVLTAIDVKCGTSLPFEFKTILIVSGWCFIGALWCFQYTALSNWTVINSRASDNFDRVNLHRTIRDHDERIRQDGLLPAVNDSDYSSSPVAYTTYGLAFTSGFMPQCDNRPRSPPFWFPSPRSWKELYRNPARPHRRSELLGWEYFYSAYSDTFSFISHWGQRQLDNVETMLYATFLNATTLELNPDTVRAFFRQSAARPQPVQVRYTNEPARLLCVHQFNFLKDILMADRTKYAFLPTTVCEVVLHATTVDIIYDRGIVSTAVADRRPFEDSNSGRVVVRIQWYIRMVWLVTLIPAKLKNELQHLGRDDVVFDCDPIRLIATTTAIGGLEGQLFGLEHHGGLRRNEEIEIRHVVESASMEGRKRLGVSELRLTM
ncbi:hypothetical protein EV424DRAFT_1349036 [Suillus variegatus]|nr:hypothetical protein EV424DRAFT_1349036 [Suillus variegatus]